METPSIAIFRFFPLPFTESPMESINSGLTKAAAETTTPAPSVVTMPLSLTSAESASGSSQSAWPDQPLTIAGSSPSGNVGTGGTDDGRDIWSGGSDDESSEDCQHPVGPPFAACTHTEKEKLEAYRGLMRERALNDKDKTDAKSRLSKRKTAEDLAWLLGLPTGVAAVIGLACCVCCCIRSHKRKRRRQREEQRRQERDRRDHIELPQWIPNPRETLLDPQVPEDNPERRHSIGADSQMTGSTAVMDPQDDHPPADTPVPPSGSSPPSEPEAEGLQRPPPAHFPSRD